MPNELANLTPDDWCALASLDPSARDVEILDPAMLRRWHDAYIVSGLGGCTAQVLSFGQGVIAAARVLGAGWAENAKREAVLASLREKLAAGAMEIPYDPSAGRPAVERAVDDGECTCHKCQWSASGLPPGEG